jgi:hypothetical protein
MDELRWIVNGFLEWHEGAPCPDGLIERARAAVPPAYAMADDETRDDDLWDAAQRKLDSGEMLTKQEANAYFAGSLFNPTNQVYFRAGFIACREYMARFVEPQSPEIAASIRANWLPKLGPDFGPPRRVDWNELVASGDAFPVQMREDISPTLEALPIALQFLETPEPVPTTGLKETSA